MRFPLKWVLVAGSLDINNWEKEFIRKEIGTSSLSSDRQRRDPCPSLSSLHSRLERVSDCMQTPGWRAETGPTIHKEAEARVQNWEARPPSSTVLCKSVFPSSSPTPAKPGINGLVLPQLCEGASVFT